MAAMPTTTITREKREYDRIELENIRERLKLKRKRAVKILN